MNYPIYFLVALGLAWLVSASGKDENDWEFLHYKFFNCKGAKRTPAETLDLIQRLYPQEKDEKSKKELRYLLMFSKPEKSGCYWGELNDFHIFIKKYNAIGCKNIVDYLEFYQGETLKECESRWKKSVNQFTDEEKNLIDLIEQSVNAAKLASGDGRSNRWTDDYHVIGLLKFMEEHANLAKPTSREDKAQCNQKFQELIQNPCKKVMSSLSGLHHYSNKDEFANVWIANLEVCEDVNIHGRDYNTATCQLWVDKYQPQKPVESKPELELEPTITEAAQPAKRKGFFNCLRRKKSQSS